MWSGMYDDLLEDALSRQQQYLPAVGFLKLKGLSSATHQRLADWMLETCEDFRCDSEVFSTAVTIMGRFISVSPAVRAEDLPVIGFAAVFIACKQSGKCIHANTLCKYLQYAFTETQLKQQEVAILNALDWRLDSPKAHDFLDQFMQRLPFNITPQESSNLRTRSEVFIDMFYSDANYVTYGPAMIAAAALYCGITGIEGDGGAVPMYNQIPAAFHTTCFGLSTFFPTNGEKIKLTTCIESLQRIYRSYSDVSPLHSRASYRG